MPARGHTTLDPGEVVVEDLSRRLREAVSRGRPANGNGSNGSGRERARRVAVDVGVAMLADASAGTAEHSSDVVLITEAIGERMGIEGDDANDLLAAAQLHDIGKAWVPSGLLEKPGPLTDEEWEVMRQHTVVGERILSSVDELGGVGRLVRHSHERWDGAGYPDGLAGSDIPLGSRIIFCADAFHAIRCDRPYRAGRSAREAVTEINRCAGAQFDPRVAGALEQVVRERSKRPQVGGGSTRLLALLMCLVVAGAGTAMARSGLFGELPPAPLASATSGTQPAGCGTAACPNVAAPVGGLGPVGALSGTPGPRPLSPGLPGRKHRHGRGAKGKGGGEGNAGKGNHGKAAEAKQRHAGHDDSGNHYGSEGSPGSSGSAASAGQSGASSAGSSSGHSGGSSSHGSSSHHSSSSHGSSSHAVSHGSSGSNGGGGSGGNAGGNGGGNGH
jgi:hypothetical protein